MSDMTDQQQPVDTAEEALRAAFVDAGLTFAIPWATHQLGLARAGAELALARSGASASEREGFLATTATLTHHQLLNEATALREAEARRAAKVLNEYRQSASTQRRHQRQVTIAIPRLTDF